MSINLTFPFGEIVVVFSTLCAWLAAGVVAAGAVCAYRVPPRRIRLERVLGRSRRPAVRAEPATQEREAA